MQHYLLKKARGLEVACRPGTTDESAFKRCWFKDATGKTPTLAPC